jgi:hypothetical protein
MVKHAYEDLTRYWFRKFRRIAELAGVKKHFGFGRWGIKVISYVLLSPVGFPILISPLVQNNLVPVFVGRIMIHLTLYIHKIRER